MKSKVAQTPYWEAKSQDARRRANINVLKIKAEQAGLKIQEYLDKIGVTRDEFLAGKRGK